MSREQQLSAGLSALGIDLSAEVQAKLLAYTLFLEKWNRSFSLTALRDPTLAVSHHLLDSLAILPYVTAPNLLDVGSGGGQPGIPLAIAKPELTVTLLDSNSKKTAFLQQAVIELGLKNVQVVTARVEEYKPAVPFAAITSRAFAELVDFVELTRHLLAPDGVWLAMKGQRPEAEIAKLPAGVSVSAVHRLVVPGVDGERHLVVIREQ
ncbi:MAG: 16S rRNA (guanine(527)-N(7))-methyltransferase RsmG [Betaproteobacteria bacterium]|nr:16S rRNA (guanine(527)-N(7))-methyltransferase RsmG [Betaproteobacteria bacterium]